MKIWEWMAWEKIPGKIGVFQKLLLPCLLQYIFNKLKALAFLKVLCDIDSEIRDTKVLISWLFLEMENCQTILLEYLV